MTDVDDPYDSYLSSDEWQARRKLKLQVSGFKCQLCSRRSGLLDVHHNTYERVGAELDTGYGQFWGMRSGSGLVLGSGDRLAVAEADAANDLGEAVGAVQSAPVALG